MLSQDLIGSALPAVPNDELDTAVVEDVKDIAKGTAEKVKETATQGSGFGMLTKLIIFGAIVGLAVLFLKSRKNPTDKSLA